MDSKGFNWTSMCVEIAETKVPRRFSHSHRPSPQTHSINDLQLPACLITVWLAQDDLPPPSAPSLSPQISAWFRNYQESRVFSMDPAGTRRAPSRHFYQMMWWVWIFFSLSHLPLVFYYNIRPLIELNQACNPGIADSSSLQIAARLLCHY